MRTYKTKQGQTWDMIAKEVYGSEKEIGVLMQNNPNQLTFFVFPEGVELNIVEIEVDKMADKLPPWR